MWRDTLAPESQQSPGGPHSWASCESRVGGEGEGWVVVHTGKHLPGVGTHIHMSGQLSLGIW